jgi:hypothetical protein
MGPRYRARVLPCAASRFNGPLPELTRRRSDRHTFTLERLQVAPAIRTTPTNGNGTAAFIRARIRVNITSATAATFEEAPRRF